MIGIAACAVAFNITVASMAAAAWPEGADATVASMAFSWPGVPVAYIDAQMAPRQLYVAAQHPSARTWQIEQLAAARHEGRDGIDLAESDRLVGDESLTAKFFMPFDDFMALSADEKIDRWGELPEIAIASDWTHVQTIEATAFVCAIWDNRRQAVGGNGPFETAKMRGGYDRPGSAVPPAPDRKSLSLASWLKRDIPPRAYLLGGVMCTTSRWFIFGETGIGKTLLGLDMGAAIAAGLDFLKWTGQRSARVMYIDGELPIETFKERIERAANRYGEDLQFFGYNRDALGDDAMPPLNTEAGQMWLRREADAIKPDLIIFDSIMCLVAGSMSEEATWIPMRPLVRELTRRHIAQIWLHHANDMGKSFGDKTREWEMDTVVFLSRRSGRTASRMTPRSNGSSARRGCGRPPTPTSSSRLSSGWPRIGASRRRPKAARGAREDQALKSLSSANT